MEAYLEIFKKLGKANALDLRARSPELDGTALIAEEIDIPAGSHDPDDSNWKAGNPVRDEGQVWTLLHPHNASHYEGRPSTLRALWGLCHTKDPAKAKPWVDPLGTSGMYMKNECYTDGTRVYRSRVDNNVYTYEAYAQNWDIVEV